MTPPLPNQLSDLTSYISPHYSCHLSPNTFLVLLQTHQPPCPTSEPLQVYVMSFTWKVLTTEIFMLCAFTSRRSLLKIIYRLFCIKAPFVLETFMLCLIFLHSTRYHLTQHTFIYCTECCDTPLRCPFRKQILIIQAVETVTCSQVINLLHWKLALVEGSCLTQGFVPS